MLLRALQVLFIALLSLPLRAGTLYDLSYGRSISGNFNLGSEQRLDLQNYGISADYLRDIPSAFLKLGAEKYSFGLGLYGGQVSYLSGGSKNIGGHLMLTARCGWLTLMSNKNWLLQVNPEFILYSQLVAGSYTEASLAGEPYKSASLSSFKGMGLLRLPIYLGRKIKWKLGNSDVFLAGSMSYLMQEFADKSDRVVATSPSTGKVSNLEKNSKGSYSLRAIALEMHASFML